MLPLIRLLFEAKLYLNRNSSDFDFIISSSDSDLGNDDPSDYNNQLQPRRVIRIPSIRIVIITKIAKLRSKKEC